MSWRVVVDSDCRGRSLLEDVDHGDECTSTFARHFAVEVMKAIRISTS